jgi:hypothetical protein
LTSPLARFKPFPLPSFFVFHSFLLFEKGRKRKKNWKLIVYISQFPNHPLHTNPFHTPLPPPLLFLSPDCTE